jgi:hypothetical protein
VGFFVLSLLLSPLLGLIILLATKPSGAPPTATATQGSPEQRSPCWQCKELVIVGASQCRFCGAELTWPTLAKPPPEQPTREAPPPTET